MQALACPNYNIKEQRRLVVYEYSRGPELYASAAMGWRGVVGCDICFTWPCYE